MRAWIQLAPLCLAFALSAPAVGQSQEKRQQEGRAQEKSQDKDEDRKDDGKQSNLERIGEKAENVVRQPIKDIGLMRDNPPEILKDAQKAPYTLVGLRRCKDYVSAIAALDVVLGPDVDAVDESGDALHERLAEAGAMSVVNALIPFRGLVREATGAAKADRKFRIMVAAGVARRGFLKGVARERKCRT